MHPIPPRGASLVEVCAPRECNAEPRHFALNHVSLALLDLPDLKQTHMYRIATALIALFAAAQFSHAQTLSDVAYELQIQEAKSIQYSSLSDLPSFIVLQEDVELKASEFTSWAKETLGLSDEVSFVELRHETDRLGFDHIRLQQHWNGIPIKGAIWILHMRDGHVRSMNGFLVSDVNQSTGTLGESDALNQAIDFVSAEVYKWEVPSEEARLKWEMNDELASYRPVGQEVLAPSSLIEWNDFRNCWRFNVYAHEPMSRQMIYVDRQSGDVLYSIDLIHESDSVGTAVTAYSGTQTFTTDWTGSQFRLREDGRGNGIETYDMNTGTNYGNAVDFTDADNFWNNINADQDEVATDAHWGSEMTYDYFWLEQGRNSIDDNGFLLRSYVHYGNNYNNAFWDGQRMTYGDGNGSVFTPLTTIDVCGHEITHGLTTFTAGLIYSYESGALNESFSDIFGTVVERHGRPGNWNWAVGEDMTPSGNGIRNLQNPNLFNDPDTYLGTYWWTSSGDNGGVHTNSGVQNKWFYILAQGESGTNDNGDSYNVTGIGVDFAADIAFRNLTVYLTPSSQFADARTYAIQSAVDLFGPCSPEVIATTNAWYAVGVGGPWSDVVAEFAGAPTTSCSGDVAFADLSAGTPTAWEWDFGDGNTDTVENPVHTYVQNGSYDVSLIATGCASNDTITKTNYITINRPTAPTTTNAAVCDSGSVTLTASGSGGTLSWYDAPVGGNLLATGTSYTTPVLTDTTTYYVEEEIASSPVTVGPFDNNFGTGGFFPGDHRWLMFDCLTPVTLNSVKVFANSAATRTVELRNSSGTVLESNTQFIPFGESRITLNFDIPLGTDHVLALNGTADLYRNNSGPSYPYTSSGLLSITQSNATQPLNYYYFFYDWEIQEAPCKSIRAEATAFVHAAIPASITAGGPTTFCDGESVTLTANAASSYDWSGGETTQSIVALASGQYTVTTTDANGCLSSASEQITTNASPTLSTSPDVAICDGDNTQLSVSGAATYNWSPAGTLNCSSCATPTATPTSNTTYQVVGTDANGCSDTAQVLVTVNALPSVAATSQDPAVCVGDCTQLNATGASTYAWTPAGDLNNPNVSNPTACPTTTTTFSVVGTDANGCENSAILQLNVNALPTVSSNSAAICSGETVGLLATGAQSYVWSPATGLSCTTCPNPDATPVATTQYSVVGTDGNGCEGSSTATVTVHALPQLTSPPASVCLGSSVQLTVTGAATYAWEPGGLTGSTVIVQPTSSTVYSITGTDGNGCENTITTQVTVLALPAISAGPDVAICDGESTPLNATGGTTYDWMPGGLSGSSITVSPTSTTSFTVTGTDANGCENTDDVLVTVNVGPTLTISNDTAVCAGESADLNVSGATSYQWNNSSTLSCSSCPNPIATPDATTTYNVTGTNTEGCESVSAVTVTVLDLPNATATPSAAICEGQSVQLSANGGTSYLWSPATGLSCTNCSDPIAAPAATTIYSVAVIDTNGCEAEATSVITVNPSPTADFTYVVTGGEVVFTNQSANYTGWLWDFGDGGFSTIEHPEHFYAANGTYTVTLIVDNGPCSDTITYEVEILGVGIEPASAMQITVVPNPTSGLVVLTATGSAYGDIRVINMLGQVALATRMTASRVEMNLADLAAGIYLLEVSIEGTVYAQRLVKQ